MTTKTTNCWIPHSISSWVVLALCTGLVRAATSPPVQDDSTSLQRLQSQLDDQTRRIDRLYRALGPHLADLEERAAALEKEQQEDKALALERIRDLVDENLTSIGSVNPAAAQFGVITTDGGVRIFEREGKTVKQLRRPGEVITCLAFSPSGNELLTGTRQGKLQVWALAEGACASTYSVATGRVARVTWLGNDKIVWGQMVTYWTEGKPVNHEQPAGAVLTRGDGKVLWQFRAFMRSDFGELCGAQDGQRLVVSEIPGLPRAAFLLEGTTGQVLQTCYDSEHGSGPLSLAISPDGNTLAVGYAPYDIILWNAHTGEWQKLLKGHSNWVVSLAFSADNQRLISGAGDSTARIWDVVTGKEIGRIRFPGESTYVEGVGLSPKGDVAFAVASGRLILAKAPPITIAKPGVL